jgi:hypothetical protein
VKEKKNKELKTLKNIGLDSRKEHGFYDRRACDHLFSFCLGKIFCPF